MKKILFVIPSLSNGGAEKVVSKISSGLVEKGYDVTILNFYKCENEYSIDDKVKRITLSSSENEYEKIGTIKRLRVLRKHIKTINPDEILCFLNHVCIYVFISLILTKFRKRITFTERCNPKYSNSKIIKIKNILQRFVKRIVVQNTGQQSLLSKKDKNKSFVVPNPIDERYLNLETKLNIEPKHIISIGRLDDQKDYPLAIKAFNNVLKKYPNLIYHIFGKGKDQEKLEKLIKELDLEDKVILEGFTTDINKVYENADIYLMTSKFEGMPNALAESMAVGIPSISTDCEFGPSDLIDNENMGILFKEHTIEAVEIALLDMIEKYSEYISKSKLVKETMKERYSLEKITEEWIKVLEK